MPPGGVSGSITIWFKIPMHIKTILVTHKCFKTDSCVVFAVTLDDNSENAVPLEVL